MRWEKSVGVERHSLCGCVCVCVWISGDSQGIKEVESRASGRVTYVWITRVTSAWIRQEVDPTRVSAIAARGPQGIAPPPPSPGLYTVTFSTPAWSWQHGPRMTFYASAPCASKDVIVDSVLPEILIIRWFSDSAEVNNVCMMSMWLIYDCLYLQAKVFAWLYLTGFIVTIVIADYY